MKIAIHQPEHFPYLGFFNKMKNVDLFVILDDAQFSKGNFHNRNKLLNKNNVEEWFTVELQKYNLGAKINEISVSESPGWKRKILAKLQQNFKFDFTKIYDNDKLLEINMNSINFCRNKLNIDTPLVYSSTLGIESNKSDRLADICREFKATEYVSGSGGKNYLDESKFDCKVSYFNVKVENYYTTLNSLFI